MTSLLEAVRARIREELALREAGFTGVVTDKKGHKRHYVNGKPVKASAYQAAAGGGPQQDAQPKAAQAKAAKQPAQAKKAAAPKQQAAHAKKQAAAAAKLLAAQEKAKAKQKAAEEKAQAKAKAAAEKAAKKAQPTPKQQAKAAAAAAHADALTKLKGGGKLSPAETDALAKHLPDLTLPQLKELHAAAGAKAKAAAKAEVVKAVAAKLQELLQPPAPPAAPKAKPAPKAKAAPPAEKPAATKPDPGAAALPDPKVAAAVKAGVEHGSMFVDYQDGVVPIDKVLKKAQQHYPGLTKEQFHEELKKLWDAGQVVLHVHNETHSISPGMKDAGLMNNGKLMGWVQWKSDTPMKAPAP